MLTYIYRYNIKPQQIKGKHKVLYREWERFYHGGVAGFILGGWGGTDFILGGWARF